MKHTTIIFSIFIFSILFFQTAKSQEVTEKKNVFDEDQLVYWFFVKVTPEKHPKTRIESYRIRLVSSNIKAGNAEEFDVQLWKYLSKGAKVAIGPFENYYEAEDAQTFYKNFSKDTIVIDKKIDREAESFYFYIDLFIRERSGSYGIKRIPAAIFPGKYGTFAEMMQTGVYQKKLAIGPFRRMVIAEEAKRRYRLQ